MFAVSSGGRNDAPPEGDAWREDQRRGGRAAGAPVKASVTRAKERRAFNRNKQEASHLPGF